MSNIQNNWILCAAQFQDRPHLLTVNANVSNEQTFWFDQIQYVPSASVSLNQSLLRIDASDLAIQYSNLGWVMELLSTTNYPNGTSVFYPTQFVEMSTTTSRANLTYQFSGS